MLQRLAINLWYACCALGMRERLEFGSFLHPFVMQRFSATASGVFIVFSLKCIAYKQRAHFCNAFNALSFPLLRVNRFIYFFFCKPATISHHEHSDSPIKYSTLNVRRISSVSTVTIAHHERVQLPNCPRTEATYCKWAWDRTARPRSMALRWTANDGTQRVAYISYLKDK